MKGQDGITQTSLVTPCFGQKTVTNQRLATNKNIACARLSDSIVGTYETSKAKIRRARLGKGGGGGGKNGRLHTRFALAILVMTNW